MSYDILAKRARAILRMTQEEMADYMGVEQSSVSRWERGKQTPSPDALARLHQACGAEYTAYSPRFVEACPTVKVLVSLTDMAARLACSAGFRTLIADMGSDLLPRCPGKLARRISTRVLTPARLSRADIVFVTCEGISRIAPNTDPVPLAMSVAPNFLDGTAVVDAATPQTVPRHTTVTLHLADGSRETFVFDNEA